MSLPGTSTNKPAALCPCIRAKYVRLLEDANEAGISVATIETGRDLERQRYYVAHGVSRTLRSYHLPQPPNGLALAFDIAPRALLREKGWAPGHPLWLKLGALGTGLGLLWGGNWNPWRDYPHFELHTCECKP